MDIWQYIFMEKLDIPKLYFSHERMCFKKDDLILAKSDYLPVNNGRKYQKMKVRFRTVGDMTCTGAILSGASTLEAIIDEVAITRISERGARKDDKRSETSMEDRKKEGYF